MSRQSDKRAATVTTNTESGKRRITLQRVVIAAVLLLLVLLAAAWRWTPLYEWLDLQSLVAIAENLRDAPHAPLVVMCAYLASAFILFPITLLNTVIVIVFGPLAGGTLALTGSALSAAVIYGIGRRLGRKTVRRIAGARVNRVSRRLARRGVMAMTIVRLFPIAPFTVVNLVAGASHIGFRDFMIGSVLGLMPGITATALFVDRAIAALREPGAETIGLLAAVVILIAVAVIVVRRQALTAPAARRAGG